MQLRRLLSPLTAGRITVSRLSDLSKVNKVDVEKTPITSKLWSLRKQRDTPASVVTEPGAPLVSEKPPLKTYITYNFSTDIHMRDIYIDYTGQILTGKLLEDLDSMAGNIAFTHCLTVDGNHNQALGLVTASVDKIVQEVSNVEATEDYALIGQVIWTGRSSLDVIVELHKMKSDSGIIDDPSSIVLLEPNSSTRVLSSLFTYVARDKTNNKAFPINKLMCSSKLEQDIYSRRESIALARKASTGSNVHNPDLSKDAIALLERGRALIDMPAIAERDKVLISSTALENCFITHPQHTNTGNKVFGGLLMHKAYDLAHATAYTFMGCYPKFKEVEEISFKRPVDIGDLIRLKSRVVYSEDDRRNNNSPSVGTNPIIQVEVTCQVVKPEKTVSTVSNTFDFVFTCDLEKSNSIMSILPTTAEEYKVYQAAKTARKVNIQE